MNKKRWIALMTAAALASMQMQATVYADTEASKLTVTPDDAEADGQKIEGRTFDGSVKNTEGYAAVELEDTSGSAGAGEDFTVTGSVESGNKDDKDGKPGYAVGVDAEAYGEDSSKNVGLTVEGDVSTSVVKGSGNESRAYGVVSNSYKQKDETVTINVKGDVSVDNSNESGTWHSNNASGILVSEAPKQDTDGPVTTVDISAGSISATAKDGNAEGIRVTGPDPTTDGEGKVVIRTSGGVSANSGNNYASGINIETNVAEGEVDIAVGGDVQTEGVWAMGVASLSDSVKTDIKVEGSVEAKGKHEAQGIISRGSSSDENPQRILVTKDVTAVSTTPTEQNNQGYTTAIQATTDSVILVGGDATASAAKSAGIELRLPSDFNGVLNPNTQTDIDSLEAKPGRIEVVGTVDGGTGGENADLRVWFPAVSAAGTSVDREKLTDKAVGALPTVITHELKNGSIVVETGDNDEKTEETLKKALSEKTFYTVNYTAKVTDENGKEDDSLGAIEVTRYDEGFTELKSEELQAVGKTAYVAKAGEKIRINLKVNKAASSEDKSETVEGKAVVTKEETDTEIITTTTTPVTKKTWTETTSYEIDLDKLKISDTNGYDATVKLVKEVSTAGEVTWSLEVTPIGGIDLDIEAIIRAVTEESNLKEITENIVHVDRVAKEKQEESEGESQGEPQEETRRRSSRDRDRSFRNSTAKTAAVLGVSRPVGGVITEGQWILLDAAANKWAFELNDGSRLAGQWAYLANPFAREGQTSAGWFMFGPDGVMMTGWYNDPSNGNWYYLHEASDGALGMMETEWLSDGREYYWLDPQDGRMMTGWVEIGGKQHYFNAVTPDVRPGSITGAKPYGAMYWNQNTPDNLRVGEDGSRTE